MVTIKIEDIDMEVNIIEDHMLYAGRHTCYPHIHVRPYSKVRYRHIGCLIAR